MKTENRNLTAKEVCLLLALSDEDWVELEVSNNNKNWELQNVYYVAQASRHPYVSETTFWKYARLPEGKEMPRVYTKNN